MNWKLYVPDPKKRSLDQCGGSMRSGNGWGCAGVLGEDGNCLGTGYGGFSGDGVGDGINFGHGRGIITLGDGWGYGMSVGRSNGDGSSNL